MKILIPLSVLLILIVGVFAGLSFQKVGLVTPYVKIATTSLPASPLPVPSPTIPLPSPSPSPTPKPSPKPSPDAKIYGPCKLVAVPMYHHVQPMEEALAKNQKNITVNNQVFAGQMDYLASKGYNTITPDQFISGLTGGLPSRPILLTFDDGYEDFYKYAYPELVKHNFKATVFLATGLMGNPDYLTWSEINEMKGSGLIAFANHTWSHKSLGSASEETIRYELETATKQLEEHGLAPVASFAYPYGSESPRVEKVLSDLGFKTAFTTVPGSYQCAKLPFDFQRIRIGSSSLANYGF